MQIPLTERAVRLAGPKGGERHIYTIEGIPNLRLFANGDGTKTWALKVNCKGETRREVLGRYPEISCRQVRGLAPRMIAELRASRRALHIPGPPGKLTLAQALDEYFDVVLVDRKTGANTDQCLRNVFTPLLDRPLDEVSLADLQRCVNAKKAAGAPAMANRTAGYARRFFRWSKKTHGLDHNPATELERVADEAPRDRVLNDAEIAAIWKGASEMPYPCGPLFKFLLLTAVRRSEGAEMRRGELDLDSGTWEIPAARTKTNKARVVPLSVAAIAVLRQALEASPDPDLLFCYTPGRLMNNFRREKARIDTLSGVSDWTIHDFRTAIATGLAELGIDEMTCDRVLNHQASATRSVIHRAYQKSEALEPRRVALETWANHVLSLVGEGPAGDTVRRLRA